MNQSERFDFTTFPTLTIDRLILREVVAADAADVFSFVVITKYKNTMARP